MEYVIIVIGAVLIKNILLAEYLGCCPFMGTSKKMNTAVGMGLAVIFVLTAATAVTYPIHHHIFTRFGLEYLQTITFILVIAALVQFVEMFLKKAIPALYQSLGIFLPLITTNCAVLGVAILCIRRDYTFIESIVFAFSSAAGFTLALILLAGIRERLIISDVPKPLQGTAIGLITGGLMALAFFGFSGVDGSLNALVQQ